MMMMMIMMARMTNRSTTIHQKDDFEYFFLENLGMCLIEMKMFFFVVFYKSILTLSFIGTCFNRCFEENEQH